jgi:hypothetical protein
MKHLYQIIFLCLFFPFFSSAQVNYQEGIITKNNGETLKGFIDYREWATTPRSVNFKTNIGDKTIQSYAPDAIRSFEVVNKDKYMSYVGTITMDNNVFPELPHQSDTSTKRDTVFLRVIYHGSPVSLLEQQDDIKTRFFVVADNSNPQELIYHEYYTENQRTQPISLYKQTLRELADKYNTTNPKIKNLINDVRFSGPDIRNVVRAINNDNSFIKTTGNSGSRFFIGGGADYLSTKFKGQVSVNNYTALAYTVTGASPRVNVGVDIFFNKNVKRLFFRGELSFATADLSRTGDYPANPAEFGYPPNFPTTPIHKSYLLKQSGITFSPQLIYNITTNSSLNVFIGTGINLNYNSYSGDTYSYIYNNTTYTVSNYYSLNKEVFSFPVNLGVVIANKVEIAANYTTPVDISNNGTSVNTITTSRYGLSVAYFF